MSDQPTWARAAVLGLLAFGSIVFGIIAALVR